MRTDCQVGGCRGCQPTGMAKWLLIPSGVLSAVPELLIEWPEPDIPEVANGVDIANA